MKSKWGILILIAAVLIVPTTALAAKKKPAAKPDTKTAEPATACRDNKSIVASAASLTANTKAGGHVFKHVVGQKTEKGKSMFASEADFKKAFSNWQKIKDAKPAPETCGTAGGKKDCIDAKSLGITEMFVCSDVDKKGNCKDDFKKIKATPPVTVGFWYANSSPKPPKGTAGKWIVNTAFPSVNADCK